MKLALQPFLVAVGAAALFALPASAQADSSALCSQVPPPSCLYQCIQQVGECNICTSAGSAAVKSCTANNCAGPPQGDNPYAENVYLPCICPNGGFEDYTTTPPHFEVVPPTSCSAGIGAKVRRDVVGAEVLGQRFRA